MDKVGYVYILTNPSFKDEIVKIGITSGTVEKRMKELHTTGVPLPFEEYASYKTTKYAEVERFMHRSLSLLADNRVNNSREFFKIKPEVALDYLMQIADLLGEGEVESCVQAAETAKSEITKRQAYQDKEEWLIENNRSMLREVIDKLTAIGLGYHLGTSDLVRTEGGAVKSIKIGEKAFSGTEIRSIFGLNSANFEIITEGNEVVFETTGKGHGVGMSQYGANQMAKNGKTYREILLHYYSGVTIEKR
jgi:SpoIID/LytB domain protein